MKVKQEIHVEEAARLAGKPSRLVAESCPDQRTTFPTSPCTNFGCPHRTNEPVYMDCSFLAGEAGPHTLEEIGRMEGITREGARLIERKALLKLRHKLTIHDADAPVHQPSLSSGVRLHPSIVENAQPADEAHHVSDLGCRKLA